MAKIENSERLIYLMKKFNIKTSDELNVLSSDNKSLIKEFKKQEQAKIGSKDKLVDDVLVDVKPGYVEYRITNNSDEIVGLKFSEPKVFKLKGKKPDDIIYISAEVFTNMIEADPTDQKMYTQWMLSVFTNLIKKGDTRAASNFVNEDLGAAKEYLTLFEGNKRKVKFTQFCNKTHGLRHISDPSNINQYEDLSQLYNAVDPFIERTASTLESALNRFVEMNDAVIPFRDRQWTIFIPKTVDAACVVKPVGVSWCTAQAGNSYFENYTKGRSEYLLPNGKPSNLYIVINNKVFTGESDELYQFHFESDQLHNRSNSSVDAYDVIISTSKGIDDYFKEELIRLAKLVKKEKSDINTNKYLSYLVKFGHCEALFDIHDVNTFSINFVKTRIVRLPDVSKFKNLEGMYLLDNQLEELHPSIGELRNLSVLSLPKNKIKFLPKEIGKLKELSFLSLVDNPIEDFPEEFGNLDISNGGSLRVISIRESDLSPTLITKLKRLVPNASIGVL